jgi:hypothetical protein
LGQNTNFNTVCKARSNSSFPVWCVFSCCFSRSLFHLMVIFQIHWIVSTL